MKGKKFPAIKDWPNRATTDPDVIKDWFGGDESQYDLGICTGYGLIVIDVDDVSSWVELTHQDNVMDFRSGEYDASQTRVVKTPSGGYHLYYHLPDGIEVRNDQAGKLGHGIDIRCDGGQVVAPPTAGYEVTNSSSIADIPEWLLEKILAKPPLPESFRTFAEQASYIKPASSEATGNRPGDAFNGTATCDELLIQHGWVFHHSDSSGNHYTRPGKNPREGISATVWHDNGRCTNWSTNSGLEVNGWLTPFSLLAQLEFNGNMRACAARLAAEGWGASAPPAPASGPATVAPEPAVSKGRDPVDEAWAGQPPGDEWAGWEPYDWTRLNSTDNPYPTVLGAEVPGEELTKEDDL